MDVIAGWSRALDITEGHPARVHQLSGGNHHRVASDPSEGLAAAPGVARQGC